MAKTFKSLLSILLAVIMVCSLMIIPSSAAKISLNKSSIILTKGYQTTLKVSGTSSTVKWSTGDKSVATVSSKGKVVGKGPGTTYIYAKVSNTTLKCKVKVVAAKITASTSDVVLDGKGDTKIVTMTVKGSHSGLTVGSTNKKVATASWVKPVEWDGDKIKLKITAKGDGEAKIKVYLKKYSSTCYKYINVSVGDVSVEDEEVNSTMKIVAYTNDVKVGVDDTYSLQVYCTDHENLGYALSDSSVATITKGTLSGLYRNFTIKGLKEGTTTLRFYDKRNTKKYIDVKVSTGSAEYYTLSKTRPSTIATGDKVLTVQVSSTSYFMLVPKDYDPAYANTVVAKGLNKYSYYTVYDQIPSRIANGDSYQEFTNSNTTYINPNYSTNQFYNYNQGTKRYVLLPKDYDEVQLNTVVAQYNDKFDYWKVYNVSPKLSNNWLEYVESWQINDAKTGKVITRYMIIPYSEYDQSRIDAIKDADTSSNSGYGCYKPYVEYPDVDQSKYAVIMYKKNGNYRYMVVPATGADIVKRNDAIKEDTGTYEPYIMYSTAPTADASKGEYVLKSQYGSKYVYILCTYEQGTDKHNELWSTVSTAAPRGN